MSHPASTIFFPIGMIRRFTTKADIKLVSQLRKQTECSIIKAKEALLQCNNDYNAALALLNTPTSTSKYQDRVASEGLIGIFNHPFGFHSSMVELNCETDFVAKNPSFVNLCQNIAQTTALKGQSLNQSFVSQIDLENLLQKIVIGEEQELEETVEQAINRITNKVKENIQLKSGFVSNQSDTISSGYAHSSIPNLPKGVGRIATLISLKHEKKLKLDDKVRQNLTIFATKLAQHCCGMAPSTTEDLYIQDYLFGSSTSVEQELKKLESSFNLKLEIADFKYLVVGQKI